MDLGLALSGVADGTAAASGAFNASWLLGVAQSAAPGRRVAAAALAMLSAGIAVQALLSQAMRWALAPGAESGPLMASGPWLASRLLLLAGSLLITMLILRRTP